MKRIGNQTDSETKSPSNDLISMHQNDSTKDSSLPGWFKAQIFQQEYDREELREEEKERETRCIDIDDRISIVFHWLYVGYGEIQTQIE